MGDPLREHIAELVRELSPVNDPTPRWRRIEAEAIRRGFSSTRAFRSWCLTRAVLVREDNQRDTWVNPAEVDAAVERMPVVARRRVRDADDLDDEINGRALTPIRSVR